MHNCYFCFDLLLTNRYRCAIIQMNRLDSWNLRYSVKLALHKAVRNNAKSDKAEDKIQDTCIATPVAAYLVNLLSLLVIPVNSIDTAGENRKYKSCSSSCSFCGSVGIKLVCELYKSIKSVNSAGQQRENNAKRYASVCCHKKLPP